METRQKLLIDDIKRKINKKEKINRITAVINLAGLPNSGKTTLMDRLLGRPISKENNFSTGFCETVAVNFAVTNLNWIEIDHDKSLSRQLKDESSKHSTEQHLSVHSESESTINPSRSSASQHEQKDSTHQMNTKGTATQSPSDYSNDMEEMILDKSIMEIVKHYEIVDILDFESKGSLYIRDVGGQIEFKHGLSLLAIGPSIFLFVFNACIGIDQAQELTYRSKKEKQTFSSRSKISTKSALLQCLSTVKALKYTKEYGNNESRQPVVLIVGTHMDYISQIEKIKKQLNDLSPTDTTQLEDIRTQLDKIKISPSKIEDIKVDLKSKVESGSVDGEDIQFIKTNLDSAIPSTQTINKNLIDIIKEHNFTDIVKYAKQLTPMFEVNNTSETDEGIQKLRSFITDFVSKPGHHFNLEYPLEYVLFALEFLKEKKSVLALKDCKEIYQKFQITEKSDEISDEISVEMSDLLIFFHSKVGILLWFNTESLKQWVVKEPQVIFSQITKVIEKTFISGHFSSEEAQENAQTHGIFDKNALQNILTDTDCDLEWNQLLDYFIHLRMIAPIDDVEDKTSEGKKYFIPCVLQNESESDLSHCEEDIMFTFKCGSVPDGLFSVLIVCLMEGVENHKISFQLQYEQIYKDKMKFLVNMDGNEEMISLKFYPSHLKVHLHPMEEDPEEPDSVAESCHLIRTTIYNVIEKAIKCLHYNKEVVKPHISFICQHCNKLHPVKEINGKFKLVCTIKGKKIKLQNNWFNTGKMSMNYYFMK